MLIPDIPNSKPLVLRSSLLLKIKGKNVSYSSEEAVTIIIELSVIDL